MYTTVVFTLSYTTLFRSELVTTRPGAISVTSCADSRNFTPVLQSPTTLGVAGSRRRSEEHTSELQSPCNLVCRLLLENNTYQITTDMHFDESHNEDGQV